MDKTYKKLIWIDDDMDKVEQLVNSVFRQLWRKDIISYVFFVGNDYKKYVELEDYSEEKIDQFINLMSDSYGYYCNDYVDINNISTKTPMEYFKETREKYVNDNSVKKLDYKEGSFDEFIPLIKNIIQDLSNDKYAFAVDLRLFHGDYEKVMNKNVIESMSIIKELKNAGYSCYPYTFFKYDTPYVDKWQETAKEKFLLEDDVWASRELLSNDENSREYKELLKICEIDKEDKNETVNE